MQNLRAVCCMVALALSALVLGTVSVVANPAKPIKVSYHDLQPEARKQVDCLADNVYFEAGYEPRDGQKAVALVTMNRVESGTFPSTICGVVKQKENSVCQFSWWCDDRAKAKHLQRRMNQEVYEQVRLVALEVYLNYGRIHDITKGALFYHADYVPKHRLGMRNLHVTVKIGQHIFYRT